MGGKWCVDNCSLCNKGNIFLLPALEILIVDAAQQFINKTFLYVWNRLPNQPFCRQNLCIVFMAFWQYFVLKLGMYLLGHTDVLSMEQTGTCASYPKETERDKFHDHEQSELLEFYGQNHILLNYREQCGVTTAVEMCQLISRGLRLQF